MLYTIKGAGHNMLQKCQNVQLLEKAFTLKLFNHKHSS